MELYDKKFLIHGSCMIRSFDQPGSILLLTIQHPIEKFELKIWVIQKKTE